jgi:molecular chaperone DnaJ
MKDFYAILGVAKNATKDEIVKAYRKGAQIHHPDKNPGDSEAESRFRDIQEAYDVLSSASKRAEYDSGGPSMRFRSRSSDGFDGMMNDFFQNSSFRGRNIQIRLEIDLQEAYSGCVKVVAIKTKNICDGCKGQGQVSNDNCPTCMGQGFVKVNNAPFEFRTNCQTCSGLGKINPAPCKECAGTGTLDGHKEKQIQISIPCGVENGTQFRMVGQGEESIRGGRNGDVIIYVLIKDHPFFTRDGLDLLVDVPVSYTQLVLGCELEIPSISGERIIVKIPQGTQSHAKLKARGKGMIVPAGILGDIIVTVKIETPKELSEDYKNVILNLKNFETIQVDPKRQQWLKNNTSQN